MTATTTIAHTDDDRPAIDEAAGLAQLAGGLVDTLTLPIQHTHQGIAQRAFGAVGPIGVPARIGHDAISGALYGTIRAAGRLGGAAAGAAVRGIRRGRDPRPLSAAPLGSQALSFVNGLLGDRLERGAPDLVLPLTASRHGEPLPSEPTTLAASVADPTDRIVVLLHGLAETTAAWRWWSETDDGTPVPTYAERLAEVGWTPLEVGYNSGLPVVANGGVLARFVGDLVDAWPTPVSEVALVGHSMGGLVAGAACHHGVTADHGWTDRVSHVVSLGTPHAGSWLARLAHGGAAAAARLPETRGLATFLDLRSDGIKDLTRGWRPIIDEQGTTAAAEAAAEERAATAILTLAALLPDAQHAFVASRLGRTRRGPLARMVGDGLVHPRSAIAPARAAREATNVVVRQHQGVGHIRLVHHPAVGDDLVEWMTPRRAPTDRRAAASDGS